MLRTILATSLLLVACAPAKDAPDSADSANPAAAPISAEPDAPAVPAASAINNSPDSIATATFAPAFGIVIGEYEHNAAGLYWKDHKVGDGKEAQIGSRVRVQYTGQLADGTGFDKGVFPFTIGGHQVIDGWEQGIAGMRVGGKRTLIIPPTLGYGAGGSGPIPANATLVFEVELMEVQ